MDRKLTATLLLMFLAVSGCASSTWVMDVQPLQGRLQWPQPPEKARIRQEAAIQGVKEEGITLKNVFTGKGENRLIMPLAVAAGGDGRIAITDSGCRCVHLYIPGERKYRRISGGGKTGSFSSPVGVVFDDELRLYISDSALGGIYVFDRNGAYLFSLNEAGRAPLRRPTGLAFNYDKKIIYAVDTAANKVYGLSKTGELVLSFGDRGEENGRFNLPAYIFWSPSGRILVTDSMNFRIQVFDGSGKFLSSFGHHGDGSGDFAMPKGVAADRDGVVYVADGLFDNIQLFNQRGEFLLTVGGRGTGEGEFWQPSGIFLGENDKLYVCDTFNRRVQVFQILRYRE